MKRQAMEAALGARILRETPIGGGCINHAAKLETDKGALFAKWNDEAPPGMFAGEAASLDALRGGSLVVPNVVAFSGAFLITEHLEPGRRVPDFDERLGRGLAELHRKTSHAFGFEIDTYCGTTIQPNRWTASWIDFYREHRLGHQLGLLRGSVDTRVFEKLLAKLQELLTEGTPALIHGDLWSGNLHVTQGGLPALIDPASYYANREAELGMMTLFGGFGARVYDAYHEAFPLEPGWRERNPLYQLYHVMNHAHLFGGAYAAQATSLARRYL
jgi:fructosamine-3-kinase